MGAFFRTVAAAITASIIGLIAGSLWAVVSAWGYRMALGLSPDFADALGRLGGALVTVICGVMAAEKTVGNFSRRAVFWMFALTAMLSAGGIVAAAAIRAHKGYGDFWALLMTRDGAVGALCCAIVIYAAWFFLMKQKSLIINA